MMLYLGLAVLMSLGCMAAVVPETKEVRLAHANNDLAFDLLRSYKNEKNAFISPFSISTALALVYLGSDGSTARAMRNVLKYDQYELTPQEINQSFQSLLVKLKQNDEDYKLSTFNSVLVEQNFQLLDSYVQALKQNYFANIENVDFANQGEQVKQKINDDVERETNDKIKNFLDQPPSADTKLFLLNAVYFLGNWQNPFNPEFTREGTFYNNGVQENTVQFMERDNTYQYSKTNDLGASVVVLPYKGNDTASMIILLPNNRTGVAELQQNLTQDELDKVLQTTRTGRLFLTVPKFSLSFKANLKNKLSDLGLGELFSDGADLSGIAGPQASLKVSAVVHQAVIDVNERGSEAAAATGIEIVPTSLPPSIRVNHPFLFLIRENQSGMILFSGRVDEL